MAPSLSTIQLAASPVFASVSKEGCLRAIGVFALYCVWKLALRAMVGTKLDKRGWGVETYWSAMVHQLTVAVFAMGLVFNACQQGKFDQWLAQTWKEGASDGRPMLAEQVFMLFNLCEVVTDCIFQVGLYPGFGRAYWAHHIFTFIMTLAWLCLEVPVGFSISFGAVLEFGGASLNLASLFGKKNRWLFSLRTYAYTASRTIATVVLIVEQVVSMTVGGDSSSGKSWFLYIPVYLLLGLNWFWVSQMLQAQCCTGMPGSSSSSATTRAGAPQVDPFTGLPVIGAQEATGSPVLNPAAHHHMKSS